MARFRTRTRRLDSPLTFSAREIASDAGRAINDDAAGARGGAIWVLDGATGISDVSCTPGPSDAAWLAHYVSGWFATQTGSAPLMSQLPRLHVALTETFTSQHYDQGIAREDTPSACLGLVEYDRAHGRLEIAIIGDISVVVATPDGAVQHFTDPSVDRFGAKSLAAWREARRQGASLEEAWAITRPVIRKNRRMVNRPGGYWVINPVMPWLEGVQRRSVAVPDGARVLLVTDGYFRLVDVFNQWDAGTLLERSFSDGPRAVISELRRVEEADPDCLTHARMKVHDDATAIIAELAPAQTN